MVFGGVVVAFGEAKCQPEAVKRCRLAGAVMGLPAGVEGQFKSGDRFLGAAESGVGDMQSIGHEDADERDCDGRAGRFFPASRLTPLVEDEPDDSMTHRQRACLPGAALAGPAIPLRSVGVDHLVLRWCSDVREPTGTRREIPLRRHRRNIC